MSLCTGGGTKKSIHWNQVSILATLDIADKRKILLFEFIFFDTKILHPFFPIVFQVATPRPHPSAQLQTGHGNLKEKVFLKRETSGLSEP